MLKLGKIIREKVCKIIRKFVVYNTEQVFDKNKNFKIALWGGGCIHLMHQYITLLVIILEDITV